MRRFWREARWFYLFTAPATLSLLLFTLGPVIACFVISFTDWDVMAKPVFVGVENYQRILLEDELFWKSFRNTLYYTSLGVPIGLVGELMLALLLNMRVRGMSVYRTCFYLPSILPAVASSMLWLWIFNPQFGVVNRILTFFGWPGESLPTWLSDPKLAMPSLIIMSLWGIGGGMVIFLAGLQSIDEQLYEAATLDGAGWWAKFWNVTIPQLSPVLFFQLIMAVIGSLQAGFTQAYIMTRGGPANSTLFYVYYIYIKAFNEFQMGYASALAWILFAVILLLTVVMFRVLGRRVYYEFGVGR